MTRSAVPADSDAVALMRAAGQPDDEPLPTFVVVLVLAGCAAIGSLAGWALAGIMGTKRRPSPR